MKCVQLFLYITLLAMDITCIMGFISGESESGSAEGSAGPICKWFQSSVVSYVILFLAMPVTWFLYSRMRPRCMCMFSNIIATYDGSSAGNIMFYS